MECVRFTHNDEVCFQKLFELTNIILIKAFHYNSFQLTRMISKLFFKLAILDGGLAIVCGKHFPVTLLCDYDQSVGSYPKIGSTD